jgi:hypothetical protein
LPPLSGSGHRIALTESVNAPSKLGELFMDRRK